MNSLTTPSQPRQQVVQQKEGRNFYWYLFLIILDDLESLISDLNVGTRKVTSRPQKVSEPKPTQNTNTAFLPDDAGDLDSLMDQLSAKPNQQPQKPVSEIDSLMNELGGPAQGDLNSLLGALGGIY